MQNLHMHTTKDIQKSVCEYLNKFAPFTCVLRMFDNSISVYRILLSHDPSVNRYTQYEYAYKVLKLFDGLKCACRGVLSIL